MDKITQERINDAAEKYAFVVPYDGSNKFYNEDKLKGYIAGATAENESVQALVDALEAFILWQGPTLKNWPVMQKAHEVIAKYKEVTK